MKLTSSSFDDGAPIPAQYAFCAQDPKTHVTLSENQNPHLAWTDVPVGTRSFAVICHDPDVPSKGDDVNQEGRTVPASLARIDFFHWVLVDLPPAVVGVNVGEFSSRARRAQARPGAPPRASGTTTHRVFASDHDMSGDYYGYDGPCPPRNDEIAHRYVFTVFALDLERVALEGRFDGHEVRKAIAGHVLAQAAITGRYTLNPGVRI